MVDRLKFVPAKCPRIHATDHATDHADDHAAIDSASYMNDLEQSYRDQRAPTLTQIHRDIVRFRTLPYIHEFICTGRVATPPTLHSMDCLDLLHRRVHDDVKRLCNDGNVPSPNTYKREHSFHYGKYDGQRLVSYLSIAAFHMNAPESVLIYVDIAVSADHKHSMSEAVNELIDYVRKKSGRCGLVTQSVEQARRFWEGKLTRTGLANVLCAFVEKFDPKYVIYSNTTCMALIL